MAYITTTQLSDRLGSTLYARLTDRVDGTVADADVAQQIVDEASAEADGYLAVRYATPVNLSDHPELCDILEARVLDLAEYHAWVSSPFVNDPPERVHTLRAAATRWFTEIAAGELALPAASPPASTSASDDEPRYSVTERKFTADELDGL